MRVFDIRSPEVLYLHRRDSKLASIIDVIEVYSYEPRIDRFSAIVDFIIGQQLSLKAAEKIIDRFHNTCKNLDPQFVLSTHDAVLKASGMSQSKIKYIKNLALAISDGTLNISSLENLSDNECIKVLTNIVGIGPWTAEMFMIFSLGRENILSISDSGLNRAIKIFYGYNSITATEYDLLRSLWSPYSSIASMFLWKALDLGLIL